MEMLFTNIHCDDGNSVGECRAILSSRGYQYLIRFTKIVVLTLSNVYFTRFRFIASTFSGLSLDQKHKFV